MLFVWSMMCCYMLYEAQVVEDAHIVRRSKLLKFLPSYSTCRAEWRRPTHEVILAQVVVIPQHHQW